MKLLEMGPRRNGAAKPVRTPTVLQMEAVECGAASLGMILGYYGKHVPLEELRVACGVTRDGSSAGNLLRAARSYGLDAHGYKYDVDELRKIAPPFVVFWQFYHFVVVEGFTKDGATLNDPAGGRRSCDWEEFDRSYTGVCLTFSPGPDFTRGNDVPATTSILRAQLAGSWGAVLFVIIAGLALVVPNIALPTFTKTFIDEVLVGKSYGWVVWIAAGILGSIAVQIVLLELEQHAILRLQAKLALANASRMLWHVLYLPMTFFAQRSPAEIANRVAICDRVAELLSSRLAASSIGIVAALFYLSLMARYDRLLAGVSLGVAVLNIVALRIVARRRSDANATLLQEEAMLLGSSVSGLERIETLKSGGAESTFFMKWLGRQARVINARQRLAAPSQVLNAVPRLLITINVTAILTLGGLRVIDGAISIGTLFAFVLLMQLFIAPFTTFVELGGELQEMDGDVRRIEDVLRYPPDPPRTAERIERVRLAGEPRAARSLLRLQQTFGARGTRDLLRDRAGAAGRARRSIRQRKIDDRQTRLGLVYAVVGAGIVRRDRARCDRSGATRNRPCIRRSRDLAFSGDGTQQSHSLGPGHFRCRDRARRPGRLHSRRHRR